MNIFNDLYKKHQSIMSRYPLEDLMMERFSKREPHRHKQLDSILTKLTSAVLRDEKYYNSVAEEYVQMYKDLMRDGYHWFEAYKTANEKMQQSMRNGITQEENTYIPSFKRQIREAELTIEDLKEKIKKHQEFIESYSRAINEYKEDIKTVEQDKGMLKDPEKLARLKYQLNI